MELKWNSMIQGLYAQCQGMNGKLIIGTLV